MNSVWQSPCACFFCMEVCCSQLWPSPSLYWHRTCKNYSIWQTVWGVLYYLEMRCTADITHWQQM